MTPLPSLRFDIITLFPEIIEAGTAHGVIGRARGDGRLAIETWQLCDFTGGSHHTVDDAPYGGGPGMVMKVEPIVKAVEHVKGQASETPRTILTTPQGRRFDQELAAELSGLSNILIFCGRYEGIDERARQAFDMEISSGDYVLSGGEPAALVMIDAISRLVPGVLGSAASTSEESFNDSLLEYPQYTRPESFRGQSVPPVLLGGNHAAINSWRREQALTRTEKRRPDLLRGKKTEA